MFALTSRFLDSDPRVALEQAEEYVPTEVERRDVTDHEIVWSAIDHRPDQGYRQGANGFPSNSCFIEFIPCILAI